MSPQNLDLCISVNLTHHVNQDLRDEFTRQLLDDLLELDMPVQLIENQDLPVGAKSAAAGIEAILIKILEVGGLTNLNNVLVSWLSRDERRSITLQIGDNKLEINGISKTEQMQLVAWFQAQTSLILTK